MRKDRDATLEKDSKYLKHGSSENGNEGNKRSSDDGNVAVSISSHGGVLSDSPGGSSGGETVGVSAVRLVADLVLERVQESSSSSNIGG